MASAPSLHVFAPLSWMGGGDRRLLPGRQRHEDQGDTVYGLALETVSTQAVRGTQTRGLEQGQQ